MSLIQKFTTNYLKVMEKGSFMQGTTLVVATILAIMGVISIVAAVGSAIFGGHFLWIFVTTVVGFRLGLAAFKGV